MEYFSLSFAFNYFSLTGLMVVASLSGHPSLAADIGMAHSVTAVLFLGLSANARNVILKSSGEKSHIFFFMRSALMLPMFLASIFICGKFHDVGYLLAGMLTMRRAAEWLMEIALSEREVRRETPYAKGYFLVQAALFSLVCLSLVAAGRSFFTWSLAIWSVSPLLWLRLESGRPKLDFSGLRDLFPHVGSTLIVGIGLYMFRGMLILLLGKEYAGDLFSAFALGGIVPSIYGNVLGPGIESETRRGGAGWAQALKHDALKYLFGAMSLAGAAILIWTKSTLFFEFLGKSDLFWGAVGASLVGGAVMLLVQVERTALLQSEAVDNVFAPDLLMNLVIIASVPYAFYLLGERSLIFLFLWNSFTGWLFYKSYAAMAERPPGVGVSSAAGNDPRCLAKYAIAVLVVLPVYFQLGHGLFLDHSLAYDSGGVLKDLPIPVSVAACCLGILLLSNYRYTVRTLYLIFTVFFLMAVSAAVSAAGDMAAMKAKILLMIQYLLPWSGLILGRMFVDDESDLKIIQRAFLGVVTSIAVLQLAVSFLHGHMMLESYLYIFSIYQTPQYVPVILIGAYLISLFGLYDRNRAWVMALSFIMGVYAVASTSRSAVLMLIAGALIFLIAKPKDRLRRMNAALVLLSLLGGSMLNSPSANRKSTLLSANQEQIAALTGKYKELAGPPGIHPWDYYIDRIEHGEKRNLLFGQKSMPDRAAHPSAHNYYLDYVYGFGLVPLLPFIAFICYSLAGFWRQRRQMLSSPSLTSLCFVLLFLVLFDNFVKVGLRQPYPGIFSFFIWGVLLRMLNEDNPAPTAVQADAGWGNRGRAAAAGQRDPEMDKKVMIAGVTGGTGVVGRKIVSRLLAQGYRVRVLSRMGAGSDGRVEYFHGGLQDEDVLKRFVSGTRLVFHCAAELNDASRMWEVNVEGTRRLLRLVAESDCRYFCHLSSAGVVGRTNVKWVDEETPCDPQNVYEKSKWAAEQLAAQGLGRCSVVILRPTNVIDEDKPGALFYPRRGSWLDALKVFFKGGECAHIVHAEDVAAAALHFIERPCGRPRCFFVSCDEEPANTFAGLWSLYKAAQAGNMESELRSMPHLPWIIPFVVRRLWRGPGNPGDVRYSAKKLLAEGFQFGVGVRGAVLRLALRKMHGNRLKILNVNMSIDPIRGGGTAERTFQMSRQLAKAGVDCTILTLDLGLTATRQQELGQAKLIALPCFNRRFYLPLVSWGRIRSVVAEADIIHLMGHWTALNGIVYLAARSLKKPYVVCPAGALPIFGRSRILKRLYNWIGGKRLVVNADLCIAITSDEKNQLHDYGVKDGKISVIPNGISPEDYSSQDDAGFRARYGLGDAPFILFVGRLNRIKGPDLLLQAFCEAKEALRDFQLVFAGPDEGLLAELKGMVAAHGLDARVHFLGYLGGSEKSQAYHATEFLAIPSRQEAMSIVVLEAGIVGTPVLLTDQCGLNEIADVGGGRVVSPSVGALSKGLIELCAERDGLEAMGKKLQGYVMKRFLWDSVVNAYIELYEGMLRRHDPAQSAH